MFAMWLGEMLTEQGIGNGISLIIFAGIVASVPNQIRLLNQQGISQLVIFSVITVLTVALIVWVQEGQRRIPVQYGKRVRTMRGNRLVIAGAKEARARGRAVLTALYERLESGLEVGAGDVEGVIRMVDETPAGAQIAIRTQKRIVSPRSPGQVAYLRAIADHELAVEMVSDRRMGFLSFIGSGRVGWMLRAKLAPGARCALEHGGVAPVIIADDADLDDALPLIAKAGFYHAGQVCEIGRASCRERV